MLTSKGTQEPKENKKEQEIKAKLQELRFSEEEISESFKCINVLKSDINKKYSLWEICEELYPNITFRTQGHTRYYATEHGRIAKIIRELRLLKFVKIVGISDNKSACCLYQLQESPLKEQEFVDFYNEEFTTVASFTFDEKVSPTELNIAIKKENINYFCARIRNTYNPCKVYKKVDLKQLVAKYNLKRTNKYIESTIESSTEIVKELPEQSNELKGLKELLTKSQKQVAENQKRMNELKEQLKESQEQQQKQFDEIKELVEKNSGYMVPIQPPAYRESTLKEKIKKFFSKFKLKASMKNIPDEVDF